MKKNKTIFTGQSFDVDINFGDSIETRRFFVKKINQIPKEFKRIYNQGKIIKIKPLIKWYREIERGRKEK